MSKASQPKTPETSDIPEVTDWSTAVRGRFHTAGKKVLKPVFVEADVMEFLSRHAAKTRRTESTLANELLRRDIALIETVQS